VYCFSFCIELSLSHFYTNLPTTANWWKPNYILKISYHITKQPHVRSLLPCIFLESLFLITLCVVLCLNSINFAHRQPCNSKRTIDLQLGPCLSLDNTRQFSYLYRHSKDHILSARSNEKYSYKIGVTVKRLQMKIIKSKLIKSRWKRT